MSSIAGHACAGLTAYLCCHPWRNGPSRWAAAPFVALAVAPDLDYFAVWLFNYSANPRFSHSLWLALLAAGMVMLAASKGVTANLTRVGLLCAAVSHPLLDFLVGVHAVPLFWPLHEGVTLPVGILPSAGSLAWGNALLWRNLLIELGVLVPVCALAIALSRRCRPRQLFVGVLLVFPLWLAFLVWSISLER